MKTLRFTTLFLGILFLFLHVSTLYGQRGKIIRTASTSVMDPNGDGFVSKTTAGFSNDGYYVDEFELTMFGIPKLEGDVPGDNIGQNCGITDLIPDNNGYSVYAVRDGSNNLIFRFRVGDDNPSVEAWSIMLDTDGLFGAGKDPNASADNPGFEIAITLIKRNNAGVYVYDIDGIENCPNEDLFYSINSHFQISIGDEVSCGDPDYFYDFYVPFADLAAEYGINVNTGLRYVALTNVSATCPMSGKISDISGVDNDDPEYRNCEPCAFADLVNSQCPTAVVDLCQTCPGFEKDKVSKPTIDVPIRAGQNQITGTTVESNIYIRLEVYTNIAPDGSPPAWGAVPREVKGAYTVGTLWSITLDGPLLAFDKVVATALKDEFSVPCGNDGDNSSSTSVTVVQPNTPPVAQNQNVNVTEDTPKSITLVGTDPEGDALVYTIVASPTHGALTGTPPNVIYTPNANYTGSDSFAFQVSDGIFNSVTPGTITISVVPVNDVPVANSQSVTTNEDVAKAITLTASDADGDALTYIVVTPLAHGNLTGSGTNRTYTPDPDYFGSDSFTFKVNDGTVDSNVATVSIAVTPIGDIPIANNQNVNVVEDVPTSIILTGSDPDGDPITFTVLSSPANGSLSGTAPNLTYTPALNFNGADSFTFRVNDGTNNSNTATVSITVTPVGDVPVANSQSVTTAEDVAKAITLTGNDPDGDVLAFIIVTAPAHGVLNGTGANVTYTPNANYNGPDSFTFKVNDGSTDSNIATVSITVTPDAGDAPVANNQSVTTQEDVSKSITLTGSDPDGDAITYTIVTSPTNGTLSGAAPNVTYSPALNFTGADSFTFRVNDGTTNSNTATVTITVTAVNDAPIAVSQTSTYDLNTPKAITLTGTDADGDILSYSIVTAPTNGTLSGVAPNVTYTPNIGFTGSDSFTFKVNDGTVDSNTATVSLSLTPIVNIAPVASNQSATTQEDVPVNIVVVANDQNGDPLTYTIVSPPAHGTLTGTGPVYTYSPALNYNGADSFTFSVNDGTTNSNTATVSITVIPVGDAPIANNQSVTTAEDVSKAITLTGNDPDGSAITFIIVTPPAHGVLSGTAPNVTYTPATNYSGSDNFTFKVNDGTTDSNIATVSITVTPVSDAPIASNQSVTTPEDVAKSIILVGNDPDGSPVTYTIVTPPLQGVLSGSGANVTYTPNLNYNGSDSFTFKVNDGSSDSNIATVSITVTPVNDAPIANNQAVTTPEEIAKAIVLTATDAEGSTLTFTIITPPAHGVLTGSGATVTYTPASNFNGFDSFTFKVNDGTTDSNIATVSISVTPLNDAPVALNQNVTTPEDIAKAITLTGTDPDGDALIFAISGQPANGTLSGVAPNITYTPSSNYNGLDSFTFTISDGTVTSNVATVSITVTPIDDPPVANNQNMTTPEDEPKPVVLSASDAEGGALTYTVLTQPTHGTLTGTAPDLTYTPDLNFNGADSFTFKVNDGTTDSNVATVSIAVTPLNDAPIISELPILYSKEDTVLQVCLNIIEVEGDPITFETPVNTKGGGTMVRDVAPFDFCYIFTPPINYNGESIWNMNVNDGLETGSTSAKIVLIPVNDPPVAFHDFITVDGNASIAYDIVANDSAIAPPYKEFYDIYEQDSVDVVSLTNVVSGPFHGTVYLRADGRTIEYSPYNDYLGADSIRYRACDSGKPSLCDTAVVFIEVDYPKFRIYEGLSPNGDAFNNYWRIDGIEQYTNVVRVFDRYDNLVFETENYRNEDNNWRGQATRGLGGNALPEGTYYYTVYLKETRKLYSGYVILKRN